MAGLTRKANNITVDMTISRSFFMLVILFCGSGCGLNEREKMVASREAALAKKEQNLLLLEKRLTLREAGLQALEDSLKLKPDTLVVDSARYNPAILGTWYAVMVTTENNCPGSAVGDTKRETWEITVEDNLVIAKASVNNKLVRLYTGHWIQNRLELSASTELSANDPSRMLIILSLKDNKTLEGTRTIIRGAQCKTVFSLSLTKDQKLL